MESNEKACVLLATFGEADCAVTVYFHSLFHRLDSLHDDGAPADVSQHSILDLPDVHVYCLHALLDSFHITVHLSLRHARREE